MQIIRTLFIALIAVWCVTFLANFARIQFFLWQVRADRGIHLVAEPHVCVWRAAAHVHGDRGGWTLFLLADAPEGTRPVIYFPTWPLVPAALGIVIFAALSLFDGRSRRVSDSG